MRQYLLLGIALLLCLNAFSQVSFPPEDELNIGEVYWSEDFANGLTSDNGLWTTGDTDGHHWHWTLDKPPGEYSDHAQVPRFDTHENGFLLFPGDSLNMPGSSTNWNASLISPIIDLSQAENVSLTFQQYYRVCCLSGDLTLSYSTDSGSSWTDFSVLNQDIVIESSNPEYVLIRIPDAAGSAQVQLKFTWSDFSHFYWAIDDIKLYKSNNPFSAHSFLAKTDTTGGTLGLSYKQFSFYQNPPVHFQYTVKNIGDEDLVGSRVTYTVKSKHEDYVFHEETIEVPTLATDNSTTVYASPYTFPMMETDFIVVASCSHDSGDTLIERSDTLNFKVNEQMYARHGNTMTYGIWPDQINGTEQYDDYVVNVRMDVFSDGNIHGIYFNPHPDTDPGAPYQVSVEVWKEETHEFEVLYTSTWTYILTPEDLASPHPIYTEISQEEEIAVSPGDHLKVKIHFPGGQEQLVVGTTDDFSDYYAGLDVDEGHEYPIAMLPMIGLYISSDPYGIHELDNSKIKLRCTPNPCSSQTLVSYTLPVREDVQCWLTDLQGKVIRSATYKNHAEGEHQDALDVSDLSAGLYLYRITSATLNATLKIEVD